MIIHRSCSLLIRANQRISLYGSADCEQGDAGFSRKAPVTIEPTDQSALVDYNNWLSEHNTLRLNCMLNGMHWTTQELRDLRTAFFTGLAPSKHISDLMTSHLQKVGVAPGQYSFVHMRTESDWWNYCHSEVGMSSITQVTSFEECYVFARDAARYLRDTLDLETTIQLYIAGGNVTDRDLQEFRDAGFPVVTRGIQDPSPVARDTNAAIEWFVAKQAREVVGNVFSSFDWLLREVRTISGEPTYYYNRDPGYAKGQVQPAETMRWAVSPFPPWPPGSSTQQESCSAPVACNCAHLRSLTFEEAKPRDSGFIDILLKARSSCPTCIFNIQVFAEGKPVGEGLTNHVRVGRNMTYSNFLKLTALVPVNSFGPVRLQACCGSLDSGQCSNTTTVQHKPGLSRWSPDLQQHPGRILLHLHAKWVTGGPEALHQLHNSVNQLGLTGFLTMESRFSNGNSIYFNKFSRFIDALSPWEIRPQDVLILPEAYMGPNTKGMSDVANDVGALPIIYYLGQLQASFKGDKEDKPGFRPICLTQYFAAVEGCAPKAIMNTPMGANFMEAAEKWRAKSEGKQAKENIVLYDPDPSNFLDISQLDLPLGTEVIKLEGFTKPEVTALYKRAKVLIDTYITGCERALFESVMFDVVPIVAYHGPARDPSSFPIPKQWMWQPWDYKQLSSIVSAALQNHQKAVSDYEPMLKHTLGMPLAFLLETGNYFADDVLFVLPALCGGPLSQPSSGCSVSNTNARSVSVLAAITAMATHPFADVEILVQNKPFMEFDFVGFMEGIDSMGHSRALTFSEVQPEYSRFLSSAVYFQPPETKHRRQFAMLMPPGAMSLTPGLIARMIRHAREEGLVALLHPASGLLLVEWHTFFSRVQSLLPSMTNAPGPRDVVEGLRHLGLPVGEFRELPQGPLQIGSRFACITKQLCGALSAVWAGALWHSTVSRIPYNDNAMTWMKGAQKHCATAHGIHS
mmetsp:Transcript_32341/g.91667  ORF Transcript_32341/g.91667 Transcript_32341/m.91667 type:complete len:968 (+) Transcript_32341:361-3264(+)